MPETLQLPDYDVAPMIPRTAMPQVDEIYYPDMLVWLGSRGVKFNAGYIEPINCRVHQAINFEKALGMPQEAMLKPVLLSNDYNPAVLDGDHRWFRYLHDDKPMPFIMLELSFIDAIKLIEQYPKCYEVKA